MLKTYVIAENQRGLLIKDGRIVRLLEPGRHRYLDLFGALSADIVDSRGQFNSPWAEIVEKRHPDIAERSLETVRSAEGEVAIVFADGVASTIVKPGQVARYWKTLAKIEVVRIDVEKTPRLTRAELSAFEKAGQAASAAIATLTVEPHEAGLVYFDGKLVETVEPGRYGYWSVGRIVRFKTLDLRPTALEVTAQEILTKDRVSLRVTLTAFVKVASVETAAAATADYMSHVYKLVQFAVREAVGGRTLDEVLNDRESVDDQIVAHVRGAIDGLGVEVTELGVKDVILPGDMRELINRVVEAEKTAQANVIRRREETAATRSLLNTARLMEDSPTLLRLKELETLERVTEKIGRIDVHASSGEGLNAILDRLVSLKPKAET